MAEHFDALETRDPAERERTLLAALPGQIAHAQQHAPGFARILAGVSAKDITDRMALAQLPVTRKSDLTDMQQAELPFGGLAAAAPGKLAKMFMSPGPICDPEGRREDYWRMARPLFAAGVRAGDVVQNCFSYHFTPAGSMVEGGLAKLGCCVIPAGVGQTEMQVASISSLKPSAYTGTPSFLKIIVEKAQETGADITSLKKAVVGGEALPASLRGWLAEQGIFTLQMYGTADLGSVAYESEAMEGMILDEHIIVELVRPGTGEPVAEGEVGEVVVTTLTAEYPLIRFGTGDMSAIMPGISPCGRTNTRIKGWMGRADQTTKVKGMFVHPSQVADVVRRHREIYKARLVVDNRTGADRMILHCEIGDWTVPKLGDAIVDSIRDVTKLRGDVQFVAIGDLPNDGKVIADERKYD
jgi:phenylacetate-CoA ligase